METKPEMKLDAQPKYWFPAKRYGWGWGLPGTWQGWLVVAAFVDPNPSDTVSNVLSWPCAAAGRM